MINGTKRFVIILLLLLAGCVATPRLRLRTPERSVTSADLNSVRVYKVVQTSSTPIAAGPVKRISHQNQSVRKPTSLQLGLNAFRQCHFEQAIVHLDEAAGVADYTIPEKAEAWLYSGAAHYYLGNEPAAMERFHKAQELEPELQPSDAVFTPEVRELYRNTRQH